MKIWHLRWRFLTVLVDGLTKRIKNKISEIQLCDSTLPVWFAYWCYLDYIPQREEEDCMEGLVLYNKVSKITDRNVCFIIVFDNIFGTTFYTVK